MLDTVNLVLADATHGFWTSDHMTWSWMSGLHGWFWPVMVLIVVAVVLAAFHLGTRDVDTRGTADASPVDRRTRSARDILDERYARGEIGRAEYLKGRRELS